MDWSPERITVDGLNQARFSLFRCPRCETTYPKNYGIRRVCCVVGYVVELVRAGYGLTNESGDGMTYPEMTEKEKQEVYRKLAGAKVRSDLRERAAIAAMQGLLTSDQNDWGGYSNIAWIAVDAVKMADALIAELAREKP